MRRFTRLAFVLAAVSLSACADGGSRGTGITTTQGNIVSVEVASRPTAEAPGFFASLLNLLRPGARSAAADGALGGIRVIVENTGDEGLTDANGLFSVQGTFGGPVTLRFLGPGNGTDARAVVNPPAGAVLTLSDVRLSGGQARISRQDVAFAGLVTTTRCAEERITTVSRVRPDDGNSYEVRVGGTALRDSGGNPLPCSSVRDGDEVRTSGIVNSDGSIGAFDAEVRPRSSTSGRDRDDDDDDVSEPDDDPSGPGGGDDDDDVSEPDEHEEDDEEDSSGPGGNSGPGGGD